MSKSEFYMYGLPILTFVVGFFIGAVLCGVRVPKKAYPTIILSSSGKSDEK